MRQTVARAVAQVAQRLGNTPTVCRTCYIHPTVIDAYRDGSLFATPVPTAREDDPSLAGLAPAEALVLSLLQRRSDDIG